MGDDAAAQAGKEVDNQEVRDVNETPKDGQDGQNIALADSTLADVRQASAKEGENVDLPKTVIEGEVEKTEVVNDDDAVAKAAKEALPDIVDPAEKTTKDHVEFRTGVQPPDTEEGGKDEAESKTERTEEGDKPSADPQLEAIKANLGKLFSTKSSPQEILEATKQLSKLGGSEYGEFTFELKDGNTSAIITAQNSEIPGNRGVSNPTYSSMTHLYVNDGHGTKVAMRGNQKAADGQFDQQKGRNGQPVSWSGSGGGTMSGIVKDVDGAKVRMFTKDGKELEASFTTNEQGDVSVDLREVPKEVPKEQTQGERYQNLLNDIHEHPENHIPKLTRPLDVNNPNKNALTEQIGLVSALSDMGVQSIKVTPKGATEPIELQPVKVKGENGNPDTYFLGVNGHRAFSAKMTSEGPVALDKTDGILNKDVYEQLSKIDWAGAKVEIDYESLEDTSTTFPERDSTKSADGDQAAAEAFLSKIPDQVPKAEKFGNNIGAMTKYIESSLPGYDLPDAESPIALAGKLAADGSGFKMVKPNEGKPGDLVMVVSNQDRSVSMAGIIGKDNNVIVPVGEGGEFQSLGTMAELESGYKFAVFHPQELKTAKEETTTTTTEPINDVASVARSEKLGNPQAFQWLDKDASTAEVEAGLKGRPEQFDAQTGKFDRSQFKDGDIIVSGEGENQKMAIFVQKPDQLQEGGFITFGNFGDQGYKIVRDLNDAIPPSEDGNYRLYRAKEGASETADTNDHKTDAGENERGNFAELTAEQAQQRLTTIYDTLLKASKYGEGDINSMTVGREAVSQSANKDIGPVENLADLEAKLPDLGYESIEGNKDPKYGDFVLMKGKDGASDEVGLVYPDGKVRFGNQESTLEQIGQTHDVKLYRPNHMKVAQGVETPDIADAQLKQKLELMEADILEKQKEAGQKAVGELFNGQENFADKFNLLKNMYGNGVREIDFSQAGKPAFKAHLRQIDGKDQYGLYIQPEGAETAQPYFISQGPGEGQSAYTQAAASFDRSVVNGSDVAIVFADQGKIEFKMPQGGEEAKTDGPARVDEAALNSSDLFSGGVPWETDPRKSSIESSSNRPDQTDSMMGSYVLSSALGFDQPVTNARQLGAALVNGGYTETALKAGERDPGTVEFSSDQLQSRDIIIGTGRGSSNGSHRFVGRVGDDGKIYSASMEDGKPVWKAQDPQTVAENWKITRYRQGGADVAPEGQKMEGANLEAASDGPKDNREANEKAGRVAELLSGLYTGRSMPSLSDIQELARLGVTGISFESGDKKYDVNVTVEDGKYCLKSGDKYVMKYSDNPAYGGNPEFVAGDFATYAFRDMGNAKMNLTFRNGRRLSYPLAGRGEKSKY